MFAQAVILLLINAIINSIFLFRIPIARGHRSYFGVHVPQEWYRNSEGKRVYRQFLALFIPFHILLAAVTVWLFMMQPGFGFTALALGLMSQLCLFYGLYQRGKQAAEAHEQLDERVASTATTVHVSLRPRRLIDYVSWKWESISIGLLVILLGYTVYMLPQFSNGIPTDVTERVTTWYIGIIPVIALASYFVLTYWMRWIPQVKTVYPEHNREVFERLAEKRTLFHVQAAQWGKAVYAAIMLTFQFIFIHTASLIEKHGDGFSFAPLIALGLLAIAAMVTGIVLYMKGMSMQEEMEPYLDEETRQMHKDDSKWLFGHMGGGYYYNKDDQAIFVENRLGYGSGMTMNFAHPYSWYLIIVFITFVNSTFAVLRAFI